MSSICTPAIPLLGVPLGNILQCAETQVQALFSTAKQVEPTCPSTEEVSTCPQWGVRATPSCIPPFQDGKKAQPHPTPPPQGLSKESHPFWTDRQHGKRTGPLCQKTLML